MGEWRGLDKQAFEKLHHLDPASAWNVLSRIDTTDPEPIWAAHMKGGGPVTTSDAWLVTDSLGRLLGAWPYENLVDNTPRDFNSPVFVMKGSIEDATMNAFTQAQEISQFDTYKSGNSNNPPGISVIAGSLTIDSKGDWVGWKTKNMTSYDLHNDGRLFLDGKAISVKDYKNKRNAKGEIMAFGTEDWVMPKPFSLEEFSGDTNSQKSTDMLMLSPEEYAEKYDIMASKTKRQVKKNWAVGESMRPSMVDDMFRNDNRMKTSAVRNINGSRFVGIAATNNKVYARNLAQKVRISSGRNARVIPKSKGGFGIYVGPRKAPIQRRNF